tara:strand:+ start:452 stop:706 length:255 start_codon:yes stop_codon:yes gene_type:complete
MSDVPPIYTHQGAIITREMLASARKELDGYLDSMSDGYTASDFLDLDEEDIDDSLQSAALANDAWEIVRRCLKVIDEVGREVKA